MKNKTPLSIVLIIVWIGLAILNLIFRQINLEKLYSNIQIIGKTIAIANYVVDFFILLGFVFFFIFLLMKKKRIWKFFRYFILFLVLGEVIGIFLFVFNFDKFFLESGFSNYISIEYFIVIYAFMFMLRLIFYAFVIYFVNKNRRIL
jgi:hypothetical protein